MRCTGQPPDGVEWVEEEDGDNVIISVIDMWIVNNGVMNYVSLTFNKVC